MQYLNHTILGVLILAILGALFIYNQKKKLSLAYFRNNNAYTVHDLRKTSFGNYSVIRLVGFKIYMRYFAKCLIGYKKKDTR